MTLRVCSLLLGLLLLACEKERVRDEPSIPLSPAKASAEDGKAESEPAAPAAKDPPLHSSERQLMGTIWRVSMAGGDRAGAEAAGAAALDEVARLEQLLSEWIPESEISRVNQNAGVAPVKIGPELAACAKASLEIARWSEGAFDISWAALRDLWDFSADSAHVPPNKAAVKARLPLWNYRLIQFDEAARTLLLQKKGMQIGLGGIAKGYALDRAGEILRARGFRDFLVFAGGQILVAGSRGTRAWRVGIQHPRASDYFGFVEASDASVATSGDYEHSFTHEGRRYHHIIDPKTGFPSERTSSVTVIAKQALWADAVDTALFIMGPERALEKLASAPGGPIEAVIVGPDLKVYASKGVRPRLLMRYALDAEHHLVGRLPVDAPAGRFE